MRDIRITHPALVVCYRIVFCAKPVPTFAHDALIVRYRIVFCAKPVPICGRPLQRKRFFAGYLHVIGCCHLSGF
jgi:hypothetical protein